VGDELGRRAPSARARCPPRLWPTIATRRAAGRVDRLDELLDAVGRTVGRSRRCTADVDLLQGDGRALERAIVEEADCVEVTGSHVGLIANRKAYHAIAAALAASEL